MTDTDVPEIDLALEQEYLETEAEVRRRQRLRSRRLYVVTFLQHVPFSGGQLEQRTRKVRAEDAEQAVTKVQAAALNKWQSLVKVELHKGGAA